MMFAMSCAWDGQPLPLLHALARSGVPCDMGRALVGAGKGLLPAPRPCPRPAERPVIVLDARRVFLLCRGHVAVLSEHLPMPWLTEDQLRAAGKGDPPTGVQPLSDPVAVRRRS